MLLQEELIILQWFVSGRTNEKTDGAQGGLVVNSEYCKQRVPVACLCLVATWGQQKRAVNRILSIYKFAQWFWKVLCEIYIHIYRF